MAEGPDVFDEGNELWSVQLQSTDPLAPADPLWAGFEDLQHYGDPSEGFFLQSWPDTNDYHSPLVDQGAPNYSGVYHSPYLGWVDQNPDLAQQQVAPYLSPVEDRRQDPQQSPQEIYTQFIQQGDPKPWSPPATPNTGLADQAGVNDIGQPLPGETQEQYDYRRFRASLADMFTPRSAAPSDQSGQSVQAGQPGQPEQLPGPDNSLGGSP